MKSHHQKNVELFMLRAKQEIPVTPCIPSEAVRILRAKLILEECLETIEALGVRVSLKFHLDRIELDEADLRYEICSAMNLIETIDGCCDTKVVTTGTLSACGVPDDYFQELVDQNNLSKFGPGHSIREDGKLIKPPDHKPPRILEHLGRLHKMINEEKGIMSP